MFSRTGIHAIKALTLIGKAPAGTRIGAGELAAKIGAPRNYLGKLMRKLARKGFLVSQKGVGGGFRLKKDASCITLWDVLGAVEDTEKWTGCILGKGTCSESGCGLHGQWKKLKGSYLKFLKETKLSQIGS